MKKFLCFLSAAVIVFSASESYSGVCSEDYPKNDNKDSVVFSFVFFGCNRVEKEDQYNPAATDSSTANTAVLKKILNEIAEMKRKPDLFFFLGDLVLGQSDTAELNSQLKAWVGLFDDRSFSGISESGIELVAVPGNHEMLYYKDNNIKGHDEWPLKGATEIWMKNVGEFIPRDRDKVNGPDSVIDQMTFSFVRHKTAFVVMNTDTYNDPTFINPYGYEGKIPTGWITEKIKEYNNDPEIEHIFVLGHKPYYANDSASTGHDGLPEGPVLWPVLNEYKVTAMLSAHVHDYQRMQPGDEGTYQIVAGNGGSSGPAEFFGYSVINILSSGEVQLISKGFNKGDPYYSLPSDEPSTVRDNTILTREKNADPYINIK
ncbi:MAG: metallophosphoesterase [Bacteroidetes bacterium]|nr:metallophosphoesterase [Bacteroidota bacterium]